MAGEIKRMNREIERLNKLREIECKKFKTESDVNNIKMELMRRQIVALEKNVENLSESNRTDTSWSNESNSLNYDASDSSCAETFSQKT